MRAIFLCILVISLTSARESFAQSLTKTEATTHVLFGAYTISAFTDVSLTQYGLGKGIVYEANPIQRYFTNQGPAVSGIAKGAMHFSIGYLLFRQHNKHPKEVLLSIALLTAAQVAVDISNYKQINKNVAQR